MVDLLRSADRAAGPPPAMPPDLADRVRRAARRQRILRITSGAAAALLAIGVGTLVLVQGSTPDAKPNEPRTQIVSIEHTQAELERLNEEITRLRAELDATLALTRNLNKQRERPQRLASLQRPRFELEPADQIAQEIEKAAFIIVNQGDRLHHKYNLTESAIRSYERAIKLFPDTQSADVARERLAEIQTTQGDQL
jgi:hypothetical protein